MPSPTPSQKPSSTASSASNATLADAASDLDAEEPNHSAALLAHAPMTARQAGRSFSTVRQVWALVWPFLRAPDQQRARWLLVGIVALNLFYVYMLKLINDWNNLFYDALQNRDAEAFWHQLMRFGAIVAFLLAAAIYRFWFTQLFELRWRLWLTHDFMHRWLGAHRFYQLELGRSARPDNPDQRMQEDVAQFTQLTVRLSVGLLNAVVTLLTFIGILWLLSEKVTYRFNGTLYYIPGAMVWAALLWASFGTLVTFFLGRPQIGLSFRQQQFEANFRHHLVRVREFAEPIALSKGADVEESMLRTKFAAVFANYFRLLVWQKRLISFNVGFNQIAIVFPFIVTAPAYFSGAIMLGFMMQTANSFGRVQDALTWFVDSFLEQIAPWKAVTDRLTGFDASLRTSQSAVLAREEGATAPAFVDLSLQLPGANGDGKGDGKANDQGTGALAASTLTLSQAAAPSAKPAPTPANTLSQPLTGAITPGQHTCIVGASGMGKSTLFRALAGIWPHALGQVRMPSDVMFLPQRPYVPHGTLREALCYPHAPQRFDDAALQAALEQAELPSLAARLDEEDQWQQRLSGGELQRLALARAFLSRPAWVFADEATSALDETAQRRLTERLMRMTEDAGGALVSIAHAHELAQLHRQVWQLRPSPGGFALAPV